MASLGLKVLKQSGSVAWSCHRVIMKEYYQDMKEYVVVSDLS